MNWEISTLLGIFIMWQLIYFLLIRKQIESVKIENEVTKKVNEKLSTLLFVGNYLKMPASSEAAFSQEKTPEISANQEPLKNLVNHQKKIYSEERKRKISEAIKKKWEVRRLKAQNELTSAPDTKQEPSEIGPA